MKKKKYIIATRLSLCLLLSLQAGISYAHKPYLDSHQCCLEQLAQKLGKSLTEPVRLHLGCGEIHLPNYINIDFPMTEHTIQTKSGADIFADIATLNFPPLSITEIRSHHFFEHFDRQTAIALLCKWHEWLSMGGTLYIETPDFEECIKAITRTTSFLEKQRIIRHIFGSHEAHWAIHYDGWFQEKYEHFLTALGFSEITYEKARYLDTYNITVKAKKTRHLNPYQLEQKASELLKEYCINNSPCENKIHHTWYNGYKAAIKKMNLKK